jgi:cytochrome c553
MVSAGDFHQGKEKAKACAECHGESGNNKNSQFPRLAGQRYLYLESQLKKFQAGNRASVLMQSATAKLSAEDIDDLSTFFTSIAPARTKGDPAVVKKGEAIAARCQGCHGSDLKGRGGTPRLAGQHPLYIKKQLLNFKSKRRQGGPMGGVASSLSKKEMDELAVYFGNL